ncbi:conserved hypothetical protein [Acidothermus cellulolyticus 11B]|jgi:hypothetical protein|uniref:Integral membrane protein n=1 Tax=Acidothermus cellulolyticus (strain ATCC 43068 / DSM 8971 / 11B) TaxID=351607 RepID=A0LTD8_ACIC1|nr:DUF4191 domain-containing protein [Acidothermus cellulolyticus]ABK52698.1 conserved hypothetical protein [Acidothermus cellulolyticus 11B]MBX5447485.1 DUF4191 domain-containing protein [Acidothermus cellulolyticus]MCL6550906.1 DUF4191 domain-containing protein [Acidothermus cellulolyticus]
MARSTPPTRPNRAAADKGDTQTKRGQQLRVAFRITREHDPRLIPAMVIGGLVALVVFVGVGFALGDLIVFSIFGVLGGVLTAFIVFGRRAQAAFYAQIEGQPGAAPAVISTMRGDWRVTPTVAGTRAMDVVHRVVGKPGVILIGEGDPDRLAPLIADQQKRIQRVASGTPVEVILIGNGPKQVPLRKLQARLNRLPRRFKGRTVDQIEARLRALGTLANMMPKGPLPKGARLPQGFKLPR